MEFEHPRSSVDKSITQQRLYYNDAAKSINQYCEVEIKRYSTGDLKSIFVVTLNHKLDVTVKREDFNFY